MVAPASTSTAAAAATTTGTQSQTHTLSARDRKTIQSIKEIVGNFSDSDIYMVLKETNMDPNETTQKLLNQDPFHEVRRKRDKKKESMGYRGSVDSRKNSENLGQGAKVHTFSDRNARRGGYFRTAVPGNAQQASYTRTAVPGNAGTNREFRVVRDNRVNQNTTRDSKPVLQQGSASGNDKVVAVVTENGSSSGTSGNVRPYGPRSSSQASNGPSDSRSGHTRDTTSIASDRNLVSKEKRTVVPTAASRVQVIKSNSQHDSATLTSSNSVVGVYSSSTDPVHVPSPESRSSATVGAIKREVGVVGGCRQSSENAVKISSTSSSSFTNSVLGKDGLSDESFRPFLSISKADQISQTVATEPVMPSISVSKSFSSNQYSRLHQAAAGHQKAAQHNKEWKPKSSQKSSVGSPGVIGTPKKSSSSPVDNPKDLDSDAAGLQDKPLHAKIYENENVIIAQHIRVPETDRGRLIFGSFGVEIDPSWNITSGFQAVVTEESNAESPASLSVSVPESSSDDASGNKQVELLDDQVRISGSDSPASGAMPEHQLPDKSSTPNLDNYADIGLVRDDGPPYTPSELQQQQDPPELPSFSAYDPQTVYDISYFRPPIDETVRGQFLPSPQEALTSHTAHSMPASTVPLVQQQQQPPMAQMYPQVHLSHFANLMPYRQFLSPVYVPQMAMPGFSNNPAYPHPSNGSSYLLMPGGSSHLGANGLKYGQQFKPVPGGSPTGYGNFTSPTGYAINAPGAVGSATGLEDSSRIKYKDGNLYVPNPQAETSEIWVQNPRELPGLQSTPYYNMPGQTPHAAYMPSHTGHVSFNAAAAQSSHMQFPGLYPPPPPTAAAMANPHHLGPVMGGNVGVGVAPAAPGAQVGAYQQPQLGHLNWTTNF